MKKKYLVHFKTKSLILAAVSSLFLTGADARTWTSADGTKTFDGELSSYDAEKGLVTVVLANGQSVNFTQDKLSEADIAFVKENGAKATASSSPSSSRSAIIALLVESNQSTPDDDVTSRRRPSDDCNRRRFGSPPV